MYPVSLLVSLFFFNDTATTEIYTLSLHDALPIFSRICIGVSSVVREGYPLNTPSGRLFRLSPGRRRERCGAVLRSEEHTLNSSHLVISYAVFCLKKKNMCLTRHRPTV